MSRLANAGGYARIIFLTSHSPTMRVRAILGLTAGPVFSHYGNRLFKLEVRMDVVPQRLVWVTECAVCQQ